MDTKTQKVLYSIMCGTKTHTKLLRNTHLVTTEFQEAIKNLLESKMIVVFQEKNKIMYRLSVEGAEQSEKHLSATMTNKIKFKQLLQKHLQHDAPI
jgi:hypothetical protein